MEVRSNLDFLIHTEEIGLITAEIYWDDDTYHLFLAGDTVRSFIGSSKHFQDRGLVEGLTSYLHR